VNASSAFPTITPESIDFVPIPEVVLTVIASPLIITPFWLDTMAGIRPVRAMGVNMDSSAIPAPKIIAGFVDTTPIMVRFASCVAFSTADVLFGAI